MTGKEIGVVVALIGMLIFAVVGSAFVWNDMGDTNLSGHGYFALVLGVFFTVGLGAVLMFLVFYSNRRGYDQKVGDAPSAKGREPKE